MAESKQHKNTQSTFQTTKSQQILVSYMLTTEHYIHF